MPPNRPIELYRILADGTWDVVMVEIPATTHESQIAEVAFAVAKKQFGGEAWAIYNTYDDEVPEVPGAFIIEVEDNARCVQRFLIRGAENEEVALEKMGEGDRKQYGPDEVLAWPRPRPLGSEYKVKPF